MLHLYILNHTDVVLDVAARLASNRSSDPEWSDVHQVIEAAISSLSLNLIRGEAALRYEKDNEFCMEVILTWEAFNVMQPEDKKPRLDSTNMWTGIT